MNRLNPNLQKLLAAARRSDDSSEDLRPSPALVQSVLAQLPRGPRPPMPSLLEMMVGRGAAFAAAAGVAALSLQAFAGRSVVAPWTGSAEPLGLVFRLLAP